MISVAESLGKMVLRNCRSQEICVVPVQAGYKASWLCNHSTAACFSSREIQKLPGTRHLVIKNAKRWYLDTSQRIFAYTDWTVDKYVSMLLNPLF